LIEEIIDDEEYIKEDNDPQKVLIVPGDDYVTNDGEVTEKQEQVIATVKARTESELLRHDLNMFNKVLDSLRNSSSLK